PSSRLGATSCCIRDVKVQLCRSFPFQLWNDVQPRAFPSQMCCSLHKLSSAIVSVLLSSIAVAEAQNAPITPLPDRAGICPPDVRGNAPTIGNPSPNLSDKLADSKGVICPPAGIDPDIRVPPEQGGEIKIIPPPGSPGGDPTVQPK